MSTQWLTRAESRADIEAVNAITRAAFPTDAEALILRALRRDPAWIDGLSLVAVADDGTIVGHAVLSRCHVGEATAVMLGPVSVAPTHQGRGVGTAVVEACLEAARRVGEPLALVVGHPTYYPRFGFRRASLYGIRLSIEAPDEAVMALELRGGAAMPEGTVSFADAFGIS